MAKRPLTFVDGIGVGIGSLMILPLLYFAFGRAGFVELYETSQMELPALARVVLHPVYGYGVPLALVVVFGLAIWSRPTRWLIFAIGAAALVLSLVTYFGAYQPLFQVAGNIR